MQNHVLDYLDVTVKRVPNKIAFANETDALTFQQVYDQNRALASFFVEKGLYKEPIVVFMNKHPKTITAFFGVINSGNFYVPIDEEMPRVRIDLILDNLKPRAIVCDSQTIEIAKDFNFNGELYLYDELIQSKINEEGLSMVRAKAIDTDPIYVVFTSGSTGIPKGVVACHRSVLDYIEQLSETLEFNEDTVFGNQTPLYFDACLKEIVPTLKYGATTHLIPRRLFLLPVKLVEYLNEKKINTLCWVVSALTYISSFKTFDTVIPQHIKTIAFASEVFPVRQLNLWRAALPNTRFINLYGPTETTGICCYYEVDREFTEDEVLPVGRPFPNTEVILLDENDRISAQGEICIRGTRLTHGYFGNPEKTAEAFVQNPLNPYYPELIYRTGDIGRYNDEGELMFLSRKDNQIKHMGHRIELGEIEAAANTQEAVSSCCCVFDSDRKKIVLFYVGEISESSVKAYLKNKIPRYMIPHTVCRLDIMPLTPNGKIDRNHLKQRSKENG